VDRCREQAIGDKPRAARGGGTGGEEQVIRAKYLEWCSARIAERFLQLTPEEIYELAETASRDDPGSSRGAVVDSGSSREMTFRTMVGRVTEVLAVSLGLPSLEVWRAAYLAAPERYEAELSGLWWEEKKG
jgi:hypothetical protein